MHRTLVELGRESAWRASAAFASAAVQGRPDAGEVDGDVEALLDKAVEAHAITAGEAELILCTRIDGAELAALADAQGVSYNAIRVRRQRAERRLLVFLGFRPVLRGPQTRPSSFARVAGAGS